MWNPVLRKRYKWTYLRNRRGLTDTEHKLWFPKGRRGGAEDGHGPPPPWNTGDQQGPAEQRRGRCSAFCDDLYGKGINVYTDNWVTLLGTRTNTTLEINSTPIKGRCFWKYYGVKFGEESKTVKWKVLIFLKKQSRTHETQINVTTQHNSNSRSSSHPSLPMCPDLAYGESPPGTLAPAQPGPAETKPHTQRGPSSSPACLSPDSSWLRLSWESIQIYTRKSDLLFAYSNYL